MTTTRIAGLPFDARHAARIRQTARIYSYTRHIRRLAEDAAPDGRPVLRVPVQEGALHPVHPVPRLGPVAGPA